jgi:hypothetical protein
MEGVPPGVPPPNGGNYVRLVEGGPPGVPPPNGGNYVRLVEGGPPPNGGYGVRVRCDGALRMMRRRPSYFPFNDDAGYIGYLSDDDGSDGSDGSGGSGDEGLMSMVTRRRRELLGIDGDISFSACCLLVVIVLMMALVVVWGGFRFASSGVYDAV